MYDLSGLYIKFYECPEGKKLTDHFSELSPFPEFTECDDTRIKIAILTGDIDSPFTRIGDRETMIRAVFEELGLDVHKNKNLFKDIVTYKDDKYMFAWAKYLELLHETEFTDWLLAKRDYEFYLKKATEPQKRNSEGAYVESDKDFMMRRKMAREQVKALGEEVRLIEAKIFPDSKAAREVAMAEAKKKIFLYAEKYAEPYDYF